MADERPTRTRNDPRREATRIALIESAEVLFSTHGIDGVSLRQIGAAIGSANTTVVAYHFGSKEGLLEAVFVHRLGTLEARRTELLAAADGQGRGESLSALLDALWRPLLEQTNSEGQHSYAGFLAGLFRSNQLAARGALRDDYPLSSRLAERIHALAAPCTREDFNDRMQAVTMMLVAVLHMIDQRRLSDAEAEQRFRSCLGMMEAALTAPSAPRSAWNKKNEER